MSKVNMLLTEIALNLLGNSFYDIDGRPVDELATLYALDDIQRRIDPNRENLQQVLGIYTNRNSTTSTYEEHEDDDDDDVIHIEAPEEIINLDADEDDRQDDLPLNSSISSSERNRASITSPSNSSAITGLNDSARVLSSSKQPAASVNNPQVINIPDSDDEKEPTTKLPSYLSPTLEVRLNYLKKAVKLENEKMLKRSEQDKIKYLASNRNLKKNREELLKMFRSQQRQELFTELNSLMKFIRIIKSSDEDNKTTVSNIVRDMIAAQRNES